MARRRRLKIPALQHHKPSNRARVRIQGKDFWLGKWNAPSVESAYQQLIAELITTGKVKPKKPAEKDVQDGHDNGRELTVENVAALYMKFCKGYYRDHNGKITSTYGNGLQAVRSLSQFNDLPVTQFGPRKLTAIRDTEAAKGRSRVGCNALLKHIRRLFRWAESQEYVPRGTHYSLQTVEPLRRGRSPAPELPPVRPVDDQIVDDTLPYLSQIIADMVRLQRLTGARPGEVCGLKPVDVDCSEKVWVWRPENHKNTWREKERCIFIGPKGQKVLGPYLKRDNDHYCFSPIESERERSRTRRLNRKSPLTPSQRSRKPKVNGLRRPKEKYETSSYRRAITRALESANKDRKAQGMVSLPDWAPNQLRHAAATEIRRLFGLEAAQVVLGHSTADITQIYAERNEKLAADVILRVG